MRHTEGNGEVNVTNERKVGSVGTLGFDKLDESMGSLGRSVGGCFGGNGGRGRRRWWVSEMRAVEGAAIDRGRGGSRQGCDREGFVGRGRPGD
jgi:hypothetical protein